jgi:hypothetical protein
MANRLKLTREQLARFLPDAESIKQFEKLFTVVDEINIDVVAEAATLAGNADSKAIQALGIIAAIANDMSVNVAVTDSKVNESLAMISSIAQNTALEISIADRKATEALDSSMLALRKAKSNGVLLWLTT